MEDFDEAEEQNEEDLVELGDSFGNINLKVFMIILANIELHLGHIERIHKAGEGRSGIHNVLCQAVAT